MNGMQTWTPIRHNGPNHLGLLLQRLLNQKLVFIETPDGVESALALTNFRKACDSGRGAVFMSVARERSNAF